MQTLTKMEDIYRDFFNKQKFSSKVNDSNSFVFYYVWLLQLGTTFNLISSQQISAIVDNLTQSINALAGGRSHIVSNYLYVVTLYLQSKSKWEAWQELEKLQHNQYVTNFLQNATSWFSKKVHNMEGKLTFLLKDLQDLGNQDLLIDWNFLNKSVKELKSFSSTSTRLNLKREHNSQLAIQYCFLKPIVSSNYVNLLELTIKNFTREISILNKVDAKNILLKQAAEIQNATKHIVDKADLLKNSLDVSLKKLESEYEARMQKCIDSQNAADKKYQELENSFRDAHPDLSEDEFDEAFENYCDELPDDFWSDEVDDPEEIRSWYDSQKEMLYETFDKQEEALNDEAFISQLENEPVNQNSLENFIKEFALFTMANKSEICYPETLAEKNKMIMELSIDKAIPIFLSAFEDKLFEKDIKYLKSIS